MQTIPNLSQMARVAILVDANAPLRFVPSLSIVAANQVVKENVLEQILVIGAAGLIGERSSRRSAKPRASAPRAIPASGSTFPTRNRSPRCSDALANWTKLSAQAEPRASSRWTNDRRGLEFSLANKLLGQVDVVRYGAKSVGPGDHVTTGLAAQYPSPGSAIITTVNAAVEAFARAAAVELSVAVRVNAVSPGWVSETLQAMGRNPAEGIPASEVAKITVRQFREGATGSVAPAAVKV